MLLKTHKVINVAATLSVISHTQFVTPGIILPVIIPAVIGTLIGTTVVDIDTESSTIGQMFPSISTRLQHRGITHTIYPVLLLLALCSVFSNPFMYGLTFGYALHIFEDMFSRNGLNIIIPGGKPWHMPISYVTGSSSESLIRKLAWLWIIIILFTI